MLTIPADVKTIDLPASTMWFDHHGILYSMSKQAPAQTIEEARKTLEHIREFTGNKKVCMLIDATHSRESSREMRDFAAEELPKMVKAVAVLSHSALGKMMANLFFHLKSQPYPLKMFDNEPEAIQWLRKYL